MGYKFRWNERIDDIYPITGAISNAIENLKTSNESLSKANEKQAKELDELNSKSDQKCNDTKTDGKGGDGGNNGSAEPGSTTIFTGLLDIISKAGVNSDIITGKWSSKRNKKGVFKTKFMLDDVAGAINLKGKTDSILGDSENTRTVGSGSLKMDYYSDGKMIAEVSVLEKYKEKIFDFKKMNGDFRINRENDSMTMCDGCNGDFSANTILNAQFEVNI